MAAEERLQSDTKVKIVGLKKEAESNGTEGTILGFDDHKERYLVDCKHGTRKLLRKNLEVVGLPAPVARAVASKPSKGSIASKPLEAAVAAKPLQEKEKEAEKEKEKSQSDKGQRNKRSLGSSGASSRDRKKERQKEREKEKSQKDKGRRSKRASGSSGASTRVCKKAKEKDRDRSRDQDRGRDRDRSDQDKDRREKDRKDRERREGTGDAARRKERKREPEREREREEEEEEEEKQKEMHKRHEEKAEREQDLKQRAKKEQEPKLPSAASLVVTAPETNAAAAPAAEKKASDSNLWWEPLLKPVEAAALEPSPTTRPPKRDPMEEFFHDRKPLEALAPLPAPEPKPMPAPAARPKQMPASVPEAPWNSAWPVAQPKRMPVAEPKPMPSLKEMLTPEPKQMPRPEPKMLMPEPKQMPIRRSRSRSRSARRATSELSQGERGFSSQRPSADATGNGSGGGGGKGKGKGKGKAKGDGKGKTGQWREVQVSKAMARVLRHQAVNLGLTLRPDGFCDAEELLALTEFTKMGCTLDELRGLVANNDKQRFELAEEDGRALIRAAQGHSMKQVEDEQLLQRISADDWDLPKVCVHGTYKRHEDNIWKAGLLAGGGTTQRKHVHFAPFVPGDGRIISGMRYNCEVAVYLDLRAALKAGIPFFRSKNQVILSPGMKGVIDPRFITNIEHLS